MTTGYGRRINSTSIQGQFQSHSIFVRYRLDDENGKQMYVYREKNEQSDELMFPHQS